MSDKSNKYGYVGVDIPAQSFGSNKGVFNPAEINDLVANNQWTTFGQLELIETQTVSSVSAVEFTDLQESTYNVHFVTVNDFTISTAGPASVLMQVSTDSGSSYVSSGYQYANQTGTTAGTFTEFRGTSSSYIWLSYGGINNGTNRNHNGYFYIYNAGDSSKYTFITKQSFGVYDISDQMLFGSSVYPTANTVNAFKIFMASNTIGTADISLYGIRYS